MGYARIWQRLSVRRGLSDGQAALLYPSRFSTSGLFQQLRPDLSRRGTGHRWSALASVCRLSRGAGKARLERRVDERLSGSLPLRDAPAWWIRHRLRTLGLAAGGT